MSDLVYVLPDESTILVSDAALPPVGSAVELSGPPGATEYDYPRGHFVVGMVAPRLNISPHPTGTTTQTTFVYLESHRRTSS